MYGSLRGCLLYLCKWKIPWNYSKGEWKFFPVLACYLVVVWPKLLETGHILANWHNVIAWKVKPAMLGNLGQYNYFSKYFFGKSTPPLIYHRLLFHKILTEHQEFMIWMSFFSEEEIWLSFKYHFLMTTFWKFSEKKFFLCVFTDCVL